MQWVSLVDVKNKTSEVFRRIHGGHTMIFTHRGKPWVLALPVPENAEIEDLVFWHSDWFKEQLRTAEASPSLSAHEVVSALRNKLGKARTGNRRKRGD